MPYPFLEKTQRAPYPAPYICTYIYIYVYICLCIYIYMLILACVYGITCTTLTPDSFYKTQVACNKMARETKRCVLGIGWTCIQLLPMGDTESFLGGKYPAASESHLRHFKVKMNHSLCPSSLSTKSGFMFVATAETETITKS